MSYQDTLDRKATIKVSKRELEHFSDLLKLHETPLNYINISSPSLGSITSITHFLNYDQKQINAISKKDKQMDAIIKIYNAITKLDIEEMEVIYTKYVLHKNNEEVDKTLGISASKRKRIMSNALFNIAIILKIEVLEDIDN